MKRPRYFQWVDGEFAGIVETLADITCIDGEYFYNFTDGEACNLRYIARMTNSPADLVGKAMVEVASPQDPWVAKTITTRKYTNPGTDDTVDIPPIEDITSKTTSGTGQNLSVEHSAVGTKQYMPPKFRGPFFDLPSLEEYMRAEPKPVEVKAQAEPAPQVVNAASVNSTPVSVIGDTANTDVEIQKAKADVKVNVKPQNDGPIGILAKTCKKHSTDINITVTMDLPSRAVYNMVSEEFENGGAEFIDCMISNLDVNDVIDSIRTALLLAYSKDED